MRAQRNDDIKQRLKKELPGTLFWLIKPRDFNHGVEI